MNAHGDWGAYVVIAATWLLVGLVLVLEWAAHKDRQRR